jgi:HK97 family phage portal protein
MKIFDRIRAAGRAFRDGEYWEQFVGKTGNSYAGVTVNERTAKNYSPVFACVSLASETISTLPIGLYEKTEDGRKPRTDHPLYGLLHDRANASMSAQTFREIMQWNCELRGIALARKMKTGYGKIQELWPMSPDIIEQVYADPKTGRLFFKQKDGVILSQDDVFYFYGPGTDGISPVSRITLAKQSLSVGMAAEEYGRRYFSEGTNIGGFIRRPDGKSLSDEAFERLRKQMNQKYQGLKNSHGLIILEEGAEYQKVGLSNNDSQFLETRRFQVEEVCRWFGMKPHMIADLSHATYSNIEHQGIEAVRYTWRPRCVRWEQAINTQLITERNLYAEHNLDGLMRGDLPSQAQAWHALIQDGVLNADEVRQMLNMNPQEGGQGKVYFMPLNMIDKANPPDYSEPAPEPEADPDPVPEPESKSAKPGELRAEQRRVVDHRRKVAESFRRKYSTLAKNIVEKDAALIRQKLEELEDEPFRGWLASEYVKEFAKTVKEDSTPVFTAYAMALVPAISEEVGEVDSERYEAFTDAYIKTFSTRYGARTQKKVKALLDAEDPREAIEEQLSAWEETRADDLQREEITRQRSAFVKAAYMAAGVEKLRWVTTGKSCPFCDMLDGRIIGITQVFAGPGESLAPEGKTPLTFSSAIGHAPAHVGCDCDIVAEV